MSRSYKKTPAISSGTYNGSKRRANKKVRQMLKNLNVNFDGADFKKAYCSWDVEDYSEVAPVFTNFYKEQLRRWKNGTLFWWKDKDNPPSEEDCKKTYNKWYKRK